MASPDAPALVSLLRFFGAGLQLTANLEYPYRIHGDLADT
jgi:hypothetical protein